MQACWRFGAFVALAAGASWAVPVAARAPRSEILIDASTGVVLRATGADLPRPPASIAKVMTLYLAFDAIKAGRLRLSDPVVMTRHAAGQAPTKLGLRVGQSIPVETAIRAIAVKSANDVAVALAEKIAGNEVAFAGRMTDKARALGMSQTVFGNASGLPDRQTRTTARDIATLARAMVRDHPRYYPVFGTRSIVWRSQLIPSHNHLLGRVMGVDGIKTGYTDSAGFTLAASAKRGGRRLIAVILGASSRQNRDDRAGQLLELGFAMLRRVATGRGSPLAAEVRRSGPRAEGG